MSEFGEKFNVSRLIGSPPGYVGFGEGGRLTEAVRRNPHSVILFDEIEKAHPDVANILLQVFEDGQLTDAAGKTVSFKNTICILTSNLGNRYSGKGEIIGFETGLAQENDGASIDKAGREKMIPANDNKNIDASRKIQTKSEIKKILRNHFKPELLGRLDKVVVFKSLSDNDLKRIFKLELDKLKKRAGQRLPDISLAPEIFETALRERDPDQGARFIRNFIQEHIEPALAYYLMNNKAKKKVILEWHKDSVAVI